MAGGPGGKSVGRVSIRVVPDSSRFKADLKKSLDRIEKSTVVDLAVTADTRDAEQRLRKFAKDWNGKSLNIDIDAQTAGATAHLKAFTRKRTINLDVDITKTSLAKAGTLLATLSGARLGGDMVKNITNQLGGLDRALPKIAALVMTIGSIGAVAISSAGGLLTLTASLVPLLALAAPLPGILGAAAAGTGIFLIAVGAAKDQLSSLGPVWSNIKSRIQDNFWAKAKQPILNFVHSTMPQLMAGLGPVSSALGSWSASVVQGFQTAFAGGVLSGTLDQLRASIDIASTGTGGFARAIVMLGTFGAQYLPPLAQWFANLTTTFSGWLTRVASDGTLAAWVQGGLLALQQLESIIGSVVSTFAGLMQAASAAGGGGLATLSTALAQIASTVNSPAFQGALTTLFQGAAAGAQGLLTSLAPIGQLLTALAPTLSTILSSVGVMVGTVVGQIASALAQPVVADGLLALFQGIREGITAILPALPAVAQALAVVATFAGQLAGTFGQVLGSALMAVAPVVSGLLTALQPLIPVLGNALLSIIAAISPALQGLVPLFEGLVQAIIPLIQPIVDVVKAFLPLIPVFQQMEAQLFPALMPVILLVAQVIQQLADALVPIIQSILPPLMQLFQALMPIVMAVIGAVVQLLPPIMGLILPLLQLIGPILGPLIGLFAAVAGIVAGIVVPAIRALVPVFASVVSMITSILVPTFQVITGVLNGLIDFLTGVFAGNWKQAWGGIVKIFTSVWNGVQDIAKGTINALVDLINALIGGVNAITSKVGIPAIPKIPHLAAGADVSSSPGGTLVVLGEGGQKETVTNYGRTNAMIDAANKLALRALDGGGRGGNTFNITEVSDPVGTSMALARRLEALGA